MFKLCPPALIYVVFSLAQILIDTFKGLYNTAFMKFVVSILVTLLLNGLCDGGLGVISWIIVFIPFILMTFVVAMLLYIFGLNATIGASSVQTTKPPQASPIIKKDLIPNYSTSPAYESFTNA
jgi:hypothetical protein